MRKFQGNQHTKLTDRERFWEKVDCSGDCWVWIAGKDKDGYGKFKINNREVRAHRASLILNGISIPNDKLVCHHCDNPSCVRPSHLFIGSAFDNSLDRDTKGRTPRGEDHGSSTLCELDVWLIRNLDLSYSKMANFFDISKGHISNVIARRVWKHVD